jgi:hypothetical protein
LPWVAEGSGPGRGRKRLEPEGRREVRGEGHGRLSRERLSRESLAREVGAEVTPEVRARVVPDELSEREVRRPPQPSPAPGGSGGSSPRASTAGP